MSFGNYGLRDRSRLCVEPQQEVLCSYFDYCSLSNAKRLKMKVYLEVCLASLTDKSRGCGESQKTAFSSYFDYFSLSNAKQLKIKAFLQVSWASLTLRAPTVFKNFLKMYTIWLYWFALQQQISTLTWQKFALYYSKSIAEFNVTSRFF